jgi:hypothetical protein
MKQGSAILNQTQNELRHDPRVQFSFISKDLFSLTQYCVQGQDTRIALFTVEVFMSSETQD